jgi:hypothetical protein
MNREAEDRVFRTAIEPEPAADSASSPGAADR